MLVSRLDRVDSSFLAQVCADRMPEGSVDFKRELPAKDDRGKAEFQKDVCAFANAEGGDLVYGVVDEDGRAKEMSPIYSEASDAACRRLGQLADSGIEPRISGLRFRPVEVPGGFVLVVRVPPSFDAPHSFPSGSGRRFVVRRGTHTSDLTYQELRSAFDRTGSLAERARRFREVRTDEIAARLVSIAMVDGPFMAFHCVPIAAIAGRAGIDLMAIGFDDFSALSGADWGGCSSRFNFDGKLVYSGQPPHPAWVQVFRSGSLEFARTAKVLMADEPLIPSTVVARFARESAMKALDACRKWNVTGPAVMGLSLVGLSGYRLALGRRYMSMYSTESDRDRYVLPVEWIERMDIAEADDFVRPMLDVFWQAYGQSRCMEYDETGSWKPQI
jgi:hypothetical protein